MRFILSVFGLILFSGTLMAQNISIRGKVIDSSNQPLAGVYVLIDGTRTGVSTDFDGNYTITAPGNATLVFTSIGMQTQNVAVNGRSVINVTMADDAVMFDDVVVTALGIKKERKALGYAVQDIKSTELMKNKSANVINSLSGKIAGVSVTQTSGGAGAGASIILRGGTSLERDNQPLFVVDGIIYDNSTTINGNSGFDGAQLTNSTYSNRIMDINPEDVESMSVLKGPSAAALYGSRAAAGVIVITTKKGQEGSVQVNFGSKYQRLWANRFPEQQNLYKRGAYNESGTLLEGDATTTMSSWGAKIGSGEKMYNNIEDFFQGADIFDNTISVSGGSKNNSFYFSASNYSQTGIVPNSDYDKTTFRFNGEQRYGILTIGANVAYSKSGQSSSLTSGGLYNSNGEGAIQGAYIWPRNLDMTHWLNDDGTKYRLFTSQLVQNDFDNPYWVLNKMPMTTDVDRLTAGLNLNLDITDWWKVTYTLGTDTYTNKSRRFQSPGSGISLIYQKGFLAENTRDYDYLSSNLMTNFNKQFGDFDFNLMLGTTAEQLEINYSGVRAWNFIIPEFYVITNTSNTDRDMAQTKTQKRLVGAFGEFRVGYKNIAYLTVTGRNDWTSTLPKENRSYFYPSVSGSFVFSEFLKDNSVISFGKVRASWARVGKDADAYVTNTYVNAPEFTTYNNGDGMGIRDSWTRGNTTLIPEITQSMEYGLEMRFLNGRVGFDYTYYQNRSINQLLSPRTSQAGGYIFMTTNAGELVNNGMELSITATPVQTKNFRWDLMVNASGNRGKVKNLLPGLEILYITDVQVGNAKAASFNNGRFMAISGSKWARTDDGQLILNKDSGMPTSDGLTTKEIGNREPKVYGGINNSFQYKNWNLSFLLDYRIGGDIYNGTDYYMTNNGMSARSMNRESLSITGVIQTGTDAAGNPTYSAPQTFDYKAGQMYTVGSRQQSGEYIINELYLQGAYLLESANFMTNTNWLRLRSVSLSYTLPNSILNKQNFIKGVTATLTGTNLLLWTNYKGMDPETSAAGSGAIGSSSVGIDYCGIPALAGVSFGLNITF